MRTAKEGEAKGKMTNKIINGREDKYSVKL